MAEEHETRVRADIDHEILRRKLIAVAGEMSIQLRQTSQTSEINTERDYAVAIADRSGAVISTDNPLQLGALSSTAHAIVSHFRFDMKEGDVIVTNAAEFGGTRAVDLALIIPFFVAHSNVAYFLVRARMPDFGGMIPGGFNPDARELFAEGVPIPPLKLYREGRAVRDVSSTVLLNSRQPEEVKRAIDAMMAAMSLGARRTAELAATYGVEMLRAAFDYSQQYVERRARAAIAKWPDGTYRGEASLDHDGRGGKPVVVRVVAAVKGDTLELDFGDSDAQVPSFVNSTLSNTTGCAVMALMARLGDDVPANEGLLRAVSVKCAPGRVANASAPSPVGWSTVHCGSEITQATARALGEASPTDHGDLTAPSLLISGRPRTDRRSRLVFDSWTMGGASAGRGLDGWGRPAVSSRSILPSVEEWESSRGVRIRSLEFTPDSCGSGRWRGAPALEAVIELPADYVYTICRQGADFGATGANGGGAGAPTHVSQEELPDSASADVPRVVIEVPLQGHVLRLRGRGGAGYGSAKDRAPEAIVTDVLDGIVTAEAAKDIYGLVVSPESLVSRSSTTVTLGEKEKANSW
jgi:N-methylhydantoinase B